MKQGVREAADRAVWRRAKSSRGNHAAEPGVNTSATIRPSDKSRFAQKSINKTTDTP
jgi:hypothetical protein